MLLCCIVAGCGRPHGTVLGESPKGQPRAILAVKAGDTPTNVVVSGEMFEKCPVAGCWFRLRDAGGTIKVDTKAAGFAVVEVPLKTAVTVCGKVVWEGNEIMLEATGLRY